MGLGGERRGRYGRGARQLMRGARTRGKKGEPHARKADPPRRRANKKRGHGTSATDRPPRVGTLGRRSGQCRLRVRHHTTKRTLPRPVPQYPRARATCTRDEGKGYSHLPRRQGVVAPGQREWARDDDGDGLREGHTNTLAGEWTTLRNFLRPFRGVHKKYLHSYVAMGEHKINRKRIAPQFIAQLVQAH